MKALYVLNNDIRFNDNEALTFACANYKELSIIYFINMKESSFRLNLIKEALVALESKIRNFNQTIYICQGSKKKYIELNQNYYDHIIASMPYSRFDEEPNVSNLKYIDTQTLYKKDELNFSINELPDVFTSFRKKVERLRPTPNELLIKSMPSLTSLDLPNVKSFFQNKDLGKKNTSFHGAEEQALSRLDYYLFKSKKVLNYKETRNGMIEFDDSTKFSPWLSIGAISAKTIYRRLSHFETTVQANESTYWVYFELLWRDYFKFLACKHSNYFYKKEGIQNKTTARPNDVNQDELFKKWIESNTGDDFVDANMKELVSTGWMSNRGRQNVASYLCKELLVDWTYGAKFFTEKLIDYDSESNWGNWAYLAGVGVDPRNRKFNTIKQASIYDPNLEYRKKFIPYRY